MKQESIPIITMIVESPANLAVIGALFRLGWVKRTQSSYMLLLDQIAYPK